MADRETVERVAAAIIRDLTSEFPHARCWLAFDVEEDAVFEDAHLYVATSTESEEERQDLWRHVTRACQAAWEEADVFLVARMEGGAPILDRESGTGEE